MVDKFTHYFVTVKNTHIYYSYFLLKEIHAIPIRYRAEAYKKITISSLLVEDLSKSASNYWTALTATKDPIKSLVFIFRGSICQ